MPPGDQHKMFLRHTFEEATKKISFAYIIRLLASLLILVVLVGFGGGLIKTFLDLQLLIHHSMEIGLKQLLINVLVLLAVIEVLKTALSYLADGRVRVTYIIDTVLIVMLNEVIVSWFKGDHASYVPLIVVLLTLMTMRFAAIKFSPNIYDKEE